MECRVGRHDGLMFSVYRFTGSTPSKGHLPQCSSVTSWVGRRDILSDRVGWVTRVVCRLGSIVEMVCSLVTVSGSVDFVSVVQDGRTPTVIDQEGLSVDQICHFQIGKFFLWTFRSYIYTEEYINLLLLSCVLNPS